MEMSTQPAVLLTKWVAGQHQGQLIRCTDQPYFNHLLAVAEMAAPVALHGYELGLCHDLLEKTSVTPAELLRTLLDCGYTPNEADQITAGVVELTDVYTKTAYPRLDKKQRKEKEAARLCQICAPAQTVKYADLDNNCQWMMRYDSEHALEYLRKKEQLVSQLTAGNAGLRDQLLQTIRAYIRTLTHA